MSGKKMAKVMMQLLILLIAVTFFGIYTPVKAASTDPLVGRWERSSGGNEGMVIAVSRVKDTYKAVVLKVPEKSNFKVGDQKWKSIKLISNSTYSGKDLFVYENKKPSIYVDIKVALSGNNVLYVTSTYPSGVKASFGEKQMWKKLKNTFDATIDGWPVQNTRTSFGYFPVGKYEIDHKLYTEIFGELDKETLKKIDKKENDWKGNCFGMAITAMLFQQGKITLPNVDILSKDGYNKMQVAASDWSLKEAMLKKDSKLAKIIQRYQVYGDLVDFHENTRYHVNVLNDWDKVEPLLVEVFWTDGKGNRQGHSMVTDTSRSIISMNDGYERIYLYDPNYPYYANPKNEKLAEYYKDSTERYIDINREDGTWKINVKANGDAQAYIVSESSVIIGKKTYKNKTSFDTGLILSSLDDLDIPTSFNGKAELDLYKLDD